MGIFYIYLCRNQTKIGVRNRIHIAVQINCDEIVSKLRRCYANA